MSKIKNAAKKISHGFSDAAIALFLALAKFWMNYWIEECKKDINAVHVSISKGNRKIGHAWNVSTLPIITCPNCSECKHFCYDIRDCIKYGWSMKNMCIRARAKNTVLLLYYPEKYYREIDEFLTKYNGKYKMFRWHVGGEIRNEKQFADMVKIVKNHPDYIFWTYTKNYFSVNSYVKHNGNDRAIAIPENFRVMFSEWDGMPLINPYNFKIFTVKLKNGNKNHTSEFFDTLYECPGQCDICKELNRGCIGYENTFVNQH